MVEITLKLMYLPLVIVEARELEVLPAIVQVVVAIAVPLFFIATTTFEPVVLQVASCIVDVVVGLPISKLISVVEDGAIKVPPPSLLYPVGGFGRVLRASSYK